MTDKFFPRLWGLLCLACLGFSLHCTEAEIVKPKGEDDLRPNQNRNLPMEEREIHADPLATEKLDDTLQAISTYKQGVHAEETEKQTYENQED